MGGMPRSLSMSQLPMQYRSPGLIQFSGGMTNPGSIPAPQWMVRTWPLPACLSACADELAQNAHGRLHWMCVHTVA